MTSSTRRDPGPPASSTRWLVPLAGVAIVLAAAVAAIVLTQGAGGGSSVRPSQAPPSAATSSTGPWKAAVVEGTSLPLFTGAGSDPAVGMAAPIVRGASFSGVPLTITADGRPKVILFLAHWCPHCQREVPLIQAWLNGGGAPSDVDLMSVVTSISPTAPNYPPDAWLAREGWTVPAIADPTGSVADAYGLPAFPYWVLVDKTGKVQQRLVGELTIADLQTVIGQLRGS
jgi:thiol-disulfide isomerase/thioredoxin